MRRDGIAWDAGQSELRVRSRTRWKLSTPWKRSIRWVVCCPLCPVISLSFLSRDIITNFELKTGSTMRYSYSEKNGNFVISTRGESDTAKCRRVAFMFLRCRHEFFELRPSSICIAAGADFNKKVCQIFFGNASTGQIIFKNHVTKTNEGDVFKWVVLW